MAHEVEAFLRREEAERDRDQLDDLVEAPRSRRAQKRFQLRKREFDRIEIRTVGRQEPEVRPDAFDRDLDFWLLVHGQVVEDHDVPWSERRHEDLLDVREKRGIVDRAIEDGRRVEAVDAQGSDDRVGLPMAARRVVAQPQSPKAPPVAAQQVGRDARFIDEDVLAGIVERQPVLPPAPRGRNIRAPLFVGVYRFF